MMERTMDLRRIRYALALAEELNFARAAEKLHLSQPALSRGIQALEQELGVSLFDRDNRTVSITEVGKVFLEHARRVTYQMRSFELDMAQIRDGDIGHVTFGVGPSPTYGRAEEIEFFVADTQEISHESDLAIASLCRQRGGFFCRPGHPLIDKPDRMVKDTLSYGFALSSFPNTVLIQLRRMLGITPDQVLPVALRCDNLSVLKDLVINDDLILVATQAAVERELRAGTLVLLPFPETSALFTEIGIVHLSGRTLSPGATLVLNTIRAIAAELPETSML
jgi:DNA-binding transcriptional LysR family regulator